MPTFAPAAGPATVQLGVEVGPGQSGPVGLLVIVVLCLICVFLFRSMRKRLTRVARGFSDPDPASGAGTSPPGPNPITRPDDRADA